jgi:phosphonate transport system permease protein
MSSVYKKRIETERKRVAWRAGLINYLAFFYLAVGFVYLQSKWVTGTGMSPKLVWILAGLSLLASILWTRSPSSLGKLILHRTNPILKSLPELHREFSFKAPIGVVSLLLVAVTFILGWNITEMSLYKLFSAEGMVGAQRIFTSVFSPNWSIIGMVLESMVETIFIAFMATMIAIPLAFVGSFFSARNLMKDSTSGLAIYTVFRVLANLTRSVEPLIWAIIFSVWVGIGPFAGMLALMLHSVAALLKLYSEQIESINRGPMEAIEATGANRVQVVWYAVVPQIILPYLSFTIYRWDINIRMATVIGLVGGGGVGTLLMQYQGLAQWNEVGTIVVVIATVVWLMDYLSAKIREAIY